MSNLLDHFDFPKDITDKNTNLKAKCKHLTSLKRKHRDVYLEPITPKEDHGQSKLHNFVKQTGPSKYNVKDPKQKEITEALIKYIAGDLLSFSTVESIHFKNFVEKLDSKFQIPSRKHLSSKLIHEKAQEVRTALFENLKAADHICLTVDLWSNMAMKGFLGITAHYLSNWKMKSAMIACKRFKGRHTADNILHEYEECITSFDINDKIFCVISDNASNMVKAFNFPVPGYDDSNEHRDLNDDDLDEELAEIENPFPQHERCYAHSLQLAIKDSFEECGQNIQNVIAKVSKIVSYVRKSILASEILEDEKRLQACNATRWNSHMQMIRSVLNIPEQKLNQIDCPFSISAYDRKVLTELCKILKPFEDATLLVQKEKNVSGSMVINVTLGLKKHLQSVKCDYSTKFVSTLQTSLSKRLAQYETDDFYKTAAMLDTRFKVLWCESEQMEEATSSLKKKVSCIESVAQIDNSDDNITPPSKKMKTDDFFFYPREHLSANDMLQVLQK